MRVRIDLALTMFFRPLSLSHAEQCSWNHCSIIAVHVNVCMFLGLVIAVYLLTFTLSIYALGCLFCLSVYQLATRIKSFMIPSTLAPFSPHSFSPIFLHSRITTIILRNISQCFFLFLCPPFPTRLRVWGGFYLIHLSINETLKCTKWY